MDYWDNEGDFNSSHGRFQLAYIDLYDPARHGFDNRLSDPNVHGQFMCNTTVDVEQWRENPSRNSEGEEAIESQLTLTILLNEDAPTPPQDPMVTGESDGIYIPATDQFIPYDYSNDHPLVRRAYDREFVRKMCGKLHIVELDYLSGGETICIPKTYALRLLQRKVRNWIRCQKEARARFGNPRALMRREVSGRF
jgi:hypothetical protein